MARLAEAVAKTPKGRSGLPCPIKLLLAPSGLPKAEAADLRTLLANESVTAPQIRKGLEAIGRPISDNQNGATQAVRKHRRGDCGCPR
jgi:hypothetical protein